MLRSTRDIRAAAVLSTLVLAGCPVKEPPPKEASQPAAPASVEFVDRAWVRTRTYADEPFIGFTYVDAAAGRSVKGEPGDDCAGRGETLNHRPGHTLRLDATRTMTALEPAEIERCGLMAVPAWMVDFDGSAPTAEPKPAAPQEATPEPQPIPHGEPTAKLEPAAVGDLSSLLKRMNTTLAGAPERGPNGKELHVIAVCGVPPDARIDAAYQKHCGADGTLLLLEIADDSDFLLVVPVERLLVDTVVVDDASVTVECSDDAACAHSWYTPRDDPDGEHTRGVFNFPGFSFAPSPSRAQRLAIDFRQVLRIAATAK